MTLLFDSFWRALAYCVRARVVLLSLLPLLLMAGLAVGLGYFLWDPAMDQVRRLLETSAFVNNGWKWLDSMGLGYIKTMLAPLIVIFAVTPVLVFLSLLVVALLTMPVLVRMVAQRRFPALRMARGGSLWSSMLWSLGSTAAALLALVLTIPLWLVPPLILVLPPLVWGWLTYRVMAFDALAAHASAPERRLLLQRHRYSLVTMGVISGFLGAAPSLLWASGAFFAPAFVLLLPAAIWIYTLVFTFAALWFIHFCLAALQDLRGEASTAEVVDVIIPPPPLALE